MEVVVAFALIYKVIVIIIDISNINKKYMVSVTTSILHIYWSKSIEILNDIQIWAALGKEVLSYLESKYAKKVREKNGRRGRAGKEKITKQRK